MLAQAGVYSGTLPGQPQDTPVLYYVKAQDDAGWSSTDPAGAPQSTYSFVAGFVPLPIAVNEIMADNTATLQDPDEPGEFPDWIELHNYGPSDIDLGGLFLTDTDAEPTQFPITTGLTISAGGYLVFYADDDPEQGSLHTNFKLSASGEYLGLIEADGTTIASDYAPAFPAQYTDVSYGIGSLGGLRYFGTPTPGAANGVGYAGVVAPVAFSAPRGFYDAPFSVDLVTATPDARITFTTDGSAPTSGLNAPTALMCGALFRTTRRLPASPGYSSLKTARTASRSRPGPTRS